MGTLQFSHSPSRGENSIDLTPFGFTPTESLAYGALIDMGPTGGYALAKRLNIARANAYQALNGLVSKGAASMTDGRPRRFKPIRPDALFARVVEGESQKLDAFEAQIRGTSRSSGETMVELIGARAVHDLVMRTSAREEGPVICAATPAVIAATAPGWRRRRMIDRSSQLYSIGAVPDDISVDVVGAVDPGDWPVALSGAVLLMTAGEIGIGASERGDMTLGFWTSDQLLVGLIAAALVPPRGR